MNIDISKRKLRVKSGVLVGALPSAWSYRVSDRTGWPGVCILSLDEIVSLIRNVYRLEITVPVGWVLNTNN